MKITLAQLNYHVGNFKYNTQKIIEQIHAAKKEGADLIVFAELAICGYPPRDFLGYSAFTERCRESLKNIANECKGIACIVGTPAFNPAKKGKNLFNAACFIVDGKVIQEVHKTLLPTYDVFDENRYFEPNDVFRVIEFKGVKIALTICEDLWTSDHDSLYQRNPMDELIKQTPDLMINIAASPFSYLQANARKEVLASNAKKYQLPLLYVNHSGAQTELIFDGGSLAIDASGKLIDEFNYFQEEIRCFEFNSKQLTSTATILPVKHSKISLIHDALVLGIRDYFQKSGFSKAILGLSGGIDSAVVLALAAQALGAENMKAVLMPSQFSSDHSVDDSVEMATKLGVDHNTISINDLAQQFDQSLEPVFGDLPFGLTEENLQARIRGVLLMAISNKLGYILLNTSNKSETAVGYGTLYGDMCGGLSVIGDVYKTEVYELARYINRNKEIIPENIITKAPSAELRPDQKDSDSLPDYDTLDKILFAYIEEEKSPEEIIKMGFDTALVKKVLTMVNNNEYKRYQTPPILRISPKAFGMGRRMPIVSRYDF